MIRQIKKLIYGKNNVEIRTATIKGGEEISYFQVLHPFLTRAEVTRLMCSFYEFIKKQDDTKHRLVFEEKPAIYQKLKQLFSKK